MKLISGAQKNHWIQSRICSSEYIGDSSTTPPPNTACTQPSEGHRDHTGTARQCRCGGGTLRVFKHFSRLEADSVKIVSSRPAHQRITSAVGRLVAAEYFRYLRHANQKDDYLPSHLTSPRLYQRGGRVCLPSTTINLQT